MQGTLESNKELSIELDFMKSQLSIKDLTISDFEKIKKEYSEINELN